MLARRKRGYELGSGGDSLFCRFEIKLCLTDDSVVISQGGVDTLYFVDLKLNYVNYNQRQRGYELGRGGDWRLFIL